VDEAEDYACMKDRVMEQMKHTFRPEFLNRVDEMIVFSSLSEPELKEIINLLLKDLASRIKDAGFEMEITDAARELIMKEGFDPAYGARPLKRAIQKLVEDTVSEEILKKTFEPGDKILVDAEDGKMNVKKA
jgi:ATP-dependent Clp protease ATP-binding subunit ClpC